MVMTRSVEHSLGIDDTLGAGVGGLLITIGLEQAVVPRQAVVCLDDGGPAGASPGPVARRRTILDSGPPLFAASPHRCSQGHDHLVPNFLCPMAGNIVVGPVVTPTPRPSCASFDAFDH